MPATLEAPGRQSIDEAHEQIDRDEPSREPVAPPDVDEIKVDGTTQLELFKLGGKLPTSATIKLTGGKVALVEGEAFNKGDRIRFSGEAVVNDVGQKDAHDPKTGQVVNCEQRHEARIVDLRVDSAS